MSTDETLYEVEYMDGEVIRDLTFDESDKLFKEQYEDGRSCVVRLQDTSYRPN